uniref:Excisionase n=1 Tax=Bradyrhizobium diazoefficiens TaxID=1355477 RepID=A0A810B2D0_9BRAD|nr:hypothetical protein XF8B_03680 [Bradyrhizobium diazoefficiens]
MADRPDPAEWADDELMSLAEAAALLWPGGPLSVSSLRTAERDGRLAVVSIAGKILTTKAALREMAKCSASSRERSTRRTQASRFRDELMGRRGG